MAHSLQNNALSYYEHASLNNSFVQSDANSPVNFTIRDLLLFSNIAKQNVLGSLNTPQKEPFFQKAKQFKLLKIPMVTDSNKRHVNDGSLYKTYRQCTYHLIFASLEHKAGG